MQRKTSPPGEPTHTTTVLAVLVQRMVVCPELRPGGRGTGFWSAIIMPVGFTGELMRKAAQILSAVKALALASKRVAVTAASVPQNAEMARRSGRFGRFRQRLPGVKYPYPTCGQKAFVHSAGMKFPFALLSLSLAAACFLAACGEDPQLSQPPAANDASTAAAPATGPAITASPNPVTAGGGKTGTTAIAWNTGAGVGEVHLTINGSDEKLFARGVKGSQEAPWIAAGVSYEFRLYSIDDRSKVLARVTVTRNP